MFLWTETLGPALCWALFAATSNYTVGFLELLASLAKQTSCPADFNNSLTFTKHYQGRNRVHHPLRVSRPSLFRFQHIFFFVLTSQPVIITIVTATVLSFSQGFSSVNYNLHTQIKRKRKLLLSRRRLGEVHFSSSSIIPWMTGC